MNNGVRVYSGESFVEKKQVQIIEKKDIQFGQDIVVEPLPLNTLHGLVDDVFGGLVSILFFTFPIMLIMILILRFIGMFVNRK